MDWTIGPLDYFLKLFLGIFIFFKGWVGSFVGGLSYVLPHAGRGR